MFCLALFFGVSVVELSFVFPFSRCCLLFPHRHLFLFSFLLQATSTMPWSATTLWSTSPRPACLTHWNTSETEPTFEHLAFYFENLLRRWTTALANHFENRTDVLLLFRIICDQGLEGYSGFRGRIVDDRIKAILLFRGCWLLGPWGEWFSVKWTNLSHLQAFLEYDQIYWFSDILL